MKTRLIIVGIIITGLIIGIGSLVRIKSVKEQKKKYQKSRLIEMEIKADRCVREKNLLEAKRLYKEMLQKIVEPEVLKRVKKKLEEVNMKLLFSPIREEECSFEYIVKPNDSLAKIAAMFNTTIGLIKRTNNLTSDIIWPGQKLKINKCKFSIIIDKSQNLLFLKRGGEIIKTYIVATGKNNSTPSGKFKIINKLKNPTWFKTGAVIPPGDPENVLGTRWMGLSVKGYGIHGSKEKNEVGKHVTEGCVRMKNEDIEELYDIVPVGTEVIIID